jgi:hypothetical protein
MAAAEEGTKSPTPSDRSDESTFELTEVRTVLSRAHTAAKTIRQRRAWRSEPDHGWLGSDDPDQEDMLAELDAVVKRLERWKGKGQRW